MRRVVPPPAFPYAKVARLWPGETVVCIASGPSLTQEDVDFVRGKARVIVVNTSYLMAKWADVLYACDERWWRWNRGAKDFPGMRFALTKASKPYGVQILRNTGTNGLEHDPSGIRNGRNSGYQAINLAVHFGVSRIILLGYDMQLGPKRKAHWHSDHPNRMASPYAKWVPMFDTLVSPLRKLGVEVINCTRSTALECFPRMTLAEVFDSGCGAVSEAVLPEAACHVG